jgi:hypothetical protein
LGVEGPTAPSPRSADPEDPGASSVPFVAEYIWSGPRAPRLFGAVRCGRAGGLNCSKLDLTCTPSTMEKRLLRNILP